MPHAVRTPTNGVRTAGSACGPAGQACWPCTPVRPGSHKPLKSRGLRVPTPAHPPPHAARRPHAYKWREDGRLGVRPRRTGVLAMHACPARLT
ncbi:hypothetical protein PCASD_03285 [Puccinia coronata f. sp. avenae]|uniref:Uncharacterized protein n=1 Tax=Puccinia coronata f. sp. avenae TaxID=200324 RepID=A0A2N5VE03_9BASI|nr:hypothetical protein PCASD_03285 [Puccinia coronata f. sp. avenae]